MSARTLRSTTRVDIDVKPLARKHLSLSKSHLAELEAIWSKDPRVPTPESRRAWAEARHIEPTVVRSWFSRKLSRYKQQGLSVLEGFYVLDSGPSAGNQTSAVPREAAEKVKRERSPSPLLAHPRAKRRNEDVSARIPKAVSVSNPRPKKVKVELDGEARKDLPARHTRRHDTNPHPTCLTCARAHIATLPEDLPPSSPPPSSPPATPPSLTFSSDPFSSDAGPGSPLTPVASDDEEAEIEALLTSTPSDAGKTRIYPPIRKLAPRSIKHFALSDAYTHSLGAAGPSRTAHDETEEILSFSPSPSPEPAPPPRKKRKRVTFSDETTTFFVDPPRSFHRFSYDFGLGDAVDSPTQDQKELPVALSISEATSDFVTRDADPGTPLASTDGATESLASDCASTSGPGAGSLSALELETAVLSSPPTGSLDTSTVPTMHSSPLVSPDTQSDFSVSGSTAITPSLRLRIPPRRAQTPASATASQLDAYIALAHDVPSVNEPQQPPILASLKSSSLNLPMTVGVSQPEPIAAPLHKHPSSAVPHEESVIAIPMEEEEEEEAARAVKQEMEEDEEDVRIPGETFVEGFVRGSG